jgi:hypothetical protein
MALKGVAFIADLIIKESQRLKQDLDMVNTFIKKDTLGSMTTIRLKIAEEIQYDLTKLRKALEVLNESEGNRR